MDEQTFYLKERYVNKQAGFTLIELVAVMVILAILSVVAIPQFVDLRVDAANAAAAGVGGAIASGAAMNYATGVARSGGAETVSGCDGQQFVTLMTDATSTGAGNITVNGRLFNITGTATGLATGATTTCSIEEDQHGDTVQNFTIIGCDANCT